MLHSERRRLLQLAGWRAGSLAIVVLLSIVQAEAQGPGAQQQLALDIFRELIEIDTVTQTGDTLQAANAVAERLRAAGFAGPDVQVLSPAPRKGNLVARLRGTGKRKPVLLLAHLDVVPARRDDWSTDPFKLVERDGYFYARGTSDNKFNAATFVANLIGTGRRATDPSGTSSSCLRRMRRSSTAIGWEFSGCCSTTGR